jgi:hypothetical protein
MHELKIIPTYFNDSFFEAKVFAANGDFSGSVQTLIFFDKISEISDSLEAFDDAGSGEIVFFTGDDDLRNSSFGLKLYPRDSLGNLTLIVYMQQNDVQPKIDEISKSEIVIHCDLHSVKRFCQQIKGIIKNGKGEAALTMI